MKAPAHSSITPTTTPTPIPAWAPRLRASLEESVASAEFDFAGAVADAYWLRFGGDAVSAMNRAVDVGVGVNVLLGSKTSASDDA